MALTISKYTEKSFVVRGNTREHKEKLKELGGRWNSNLKDGAGWIFSNKKLEDVESYVGCAKKIEQPWSELDVNVEEVSYENAHTVAKAIEEYLHNKGDEIGAQLADLVVQYIESTLCEEEEIVLSEDEEDD